MKECLFAMKPLVSTRIENLFFLLICEHSKVLGFLVTSTVLIHIKAKIFLYIDLRHH